MNVFAGRQHPSLDRVTERRACDDDDDGDGNGDDVDDDNARNARNSGDLNLFFCYSDDCFYVNCFDGTWLLAPTGALIVTMCHYIYISCHFFRM